MDYLFGMDYLFDIRRANKLQLYGRGVLNNGVDIKNISEFKFHDGKMLHFCGEVESVLYVGDLEDDDLSVNEYMEEDKELSDSLNDREPVLFAEYREI